MIFIKISNNVKAFYFLFPERIIFSFPEKPSQQNSCMTKICDVLCSVVCPSHYYVNVAPNDATIGVLQLGSKEPGMQLP